jgi:site-specific recombinase XerD
MSAELLGRNNILLSQLTIDGLARLTSPAINCTSDLTGPVADYVRASLSVNTRRAYLSDLAQFQAWGGSIPATAQLVASYLAAHARTLSAATLDRHLASISKAHKTLGHQNPVGCELVKATRRGIRRVEGIAQRQAAPLLKGVLTRVLAIMGDTPKDIRDRALLLLGYAGAFRRSELVGLDVQDSEHTAGGIVISIRRSKTDQFAVGRRVEVSFGEVLNCPVEALVRWLAIAAIDRGPIFRPVDRHGNIQQNRLSAEAVSLVVKEKIAAAGLDASAYSGHSLRAGYVTDSALANVPSWKIRQQTGHTSDSMLGRYVRNTGFF